MHILDGMEVCVEKYYANLIFEEIVIWHLRSKYELFVKLVSEKNIEIINGHILKVLLHLENVLEQLKQKAKNK